jgi:hypothetical protein
MGRTQLFKHDGPFEDRSISLKSLSLPPPGDAGGPEQLDASGKQETCAQYNCQDVKRINVDAADDSATDESESASDAKAHGKETNHH